MLVDFDNLTYCLRPNQRIRSGSTDPSSEIAKHIVKILPVIRFPAHERYMAAPRVVLQLSAKQRVMRPSERKAAGQCCGEFLEHFESTGNGIKRSNRQRLNNLLISQIKSSDRSATPCSNSTMYHPKSQFLITWKVSTDRAALCCNSRWVSLKRASNC
jgi:hypothetical protein